MSVTSTAKLISAKDVAELYGVHVQTVWDWLALNRIPQPVVRGHKFTRWRLADIEAAIDEMEAAEIKDRTT